jgi:hypothetical protein
LSTGGLLAGIPGLRGSRGLASVFPESRLERWAASPTKRGGSPSISIGTWRRDPRPQMGKRAFLLGLRTARSPPPDASRGERTASVLMRASRDCGALLALRDHATTYPQPVERLRVPRGDPLDLIFALELAQVAAHRAIGEDNNHRPHRTLGLTPPAPERRLRLVSSHPPGHVHRRDSVGRTR